MHTIDRTLTITNGLLFYYAYVTQFNINNKKIYLNFRARMWTTLMSNDWYCYGIT